MPDSNVPLAERILDIKDIRAGDIFLLIDTSKKQDPNNQATLPFNVQEFHAAVEHITGALNYYSTECNTITDQALRAEKNSFWEFIIGKIIHGITTYLDDSGFIHAAMVCPMTIEGQDKEALYVVESSSGGKNPNKAGVAPTLLTEYRADEILVVRYQKGNIKIGDKRLPVEPIIESIQKMLGGNPYNYANRPYKTFGYRNLLLMVAVGLVHKTMGKFTYDVLLKLLKDNLPPVLFERIEAAIKPLAEDIHKLLTLFSHQIADLLRDRERFTCGQAVVRAFIDAEGDYPIGNTFTSTTNVQPMDDIDEATLSAVDFDALFDGLINAIETIAAKVPPSQLEDMDLLGAVAQTDMLTPGQLARSDNTYPAGKLHLP